jgi:pimeloyl-ACP methyl ester carboxylesterase
MENDHRKDQQKQSALSSNGKLIVAQKSGHHIQLDEPELVIQSIRQVLEMTRKK